jgi:hypothetical protein
MPYILYGYTYDYGESALGVSLSKKTIEDKKEQFENRLKRIKEFRKELNELEKDWGLKNSNLKPVRTDEFGYDLIWTGSRWESKNEIEFNKKVAHYNGLCREYLSEMSRDLSIKYDLSLDVESDEVGDFETFGIKEVKLFE